MLALVVLCLAAPPTDPIDDAAPAIPPAHVRVLSVNGVALEPTARRPRIWPLDDVVVGVSVPAGAHGVKVHWVLRERPPASTVELAAPDAFRTGFAFHLGRRDVAGLDEEGDYRLQVVVSDAAGAPVGQAEERIHVALPGPQKRHGKARASALDKKARAAAAARAQVPLASMTGCGAAGCASCLAGCAGAALPGIGPVVLACGLVGCMPCGTAGAVVGAGYGEYKASVMPWSLSPWLLVGVGLEVAGMSILVTSLVATAALPPPLPSLPAQLQPSVDPSLASLGFLAGSGAMLAGAPVTLLIAWATSSAPDDAKTR